MEGGTEGVIAGDAKGGWLGREAALAVVRRCHDAWVVLKGSKRTASHFGLHEAKTRTGGNLWRGV